MRYIAGDTIGRLCACLPDAHVSKEIKALTELVIAKREPNARAGCAFALGSIMSYVGGMAAGLHLRSVLGLLLSLSTDPHPSVHFWALEALEKTISSSGLGFTSHVSSCLGAVSQLILSDMFSPEDVANSFANLALESPTLASLIRCLDAIINVLGPDLQSSKKSRALMILLIRELEHCVDPLVIIETTRCTQHLTLFIPDAVDQDHLIRRLESNLRNEAPQIRRLSSEAIYAFMRKSATKLFEIASPSLRSTLWQLLYAQGQWHTEVEDIIRCWAEQTALLEVTDWVNVCLRYLTHSGQLDVKPDFKVDPVTSDPSEFIDEAAAFSSSHGGAPGDDYNSLYLPWQAIAFALNCLRLVVELNLGSSLNPRDSEDPEHLVKHVGDLIRVAFTACTSTIMEVRREGLKLLHDIIKVTSPSESY